MSGSDDSTRPISVAELLARNGTIGAPPAGGHRRRKRRNSEAVSVAELTGEIPVVRDEVPAAQVADVADVVDVIPVADAAEVVEEDVTLSAETVVVYASTTESAEAVIHAALAEEAAVEVPVEARAFDEAFDEAVDEAVDEMFDEAAADPDQAESVAVLESVETAAPPPPPLSREPRPSRRRGPQRSYDPRPARRESGAEQMAYDPVDQSVDLAELVDGQAGDAEELRSYLRSSGGPLFSGQTGAADRARRGLDTETIDAVEVRAAPPPARPRGALGLLWHGLIAVLQSLLAVVFGAGLFIAFDQLWRWNTLVALALSVLVILGLVIAVRVVRKTEDIASTLIAVAVGALVTLGPLALLQSI